MVGYSKRTPIDLFILEPPVSPIGLTLTTSMTTSNSLSWSWSPISCGNRYGVISYRYQVRRTDGSLFTVGETTLLSATIGGLSPATTYFFTVAAYTATDDTGPYSTQASGVTAGKLRCYVTVL